MCVVDAAIAGNKVTVYVLSGRNAFCTTMSHCKIAIGLLYIHHIKSCFFNGGCLIAHRNMNEDWHIYE